MQHLNTRGPHVRFVSCFFHQFVTVKGEKKNLPNTSNDEDKKNRSGKKEHKENDRETNCSTIKCIL